MGFSKIWVHGESTEVGAATITLELLAKARELADVDAALIPEVWLAHQLGGEPFLVALQRLAEAIP